MQFFMLVRFVRFEPLTSTHKCLAYIPPMTYFHGICQILAIELSLKFDFDHQIQKPEIFVGGY